MKHPIPRLTPEQRQKVLDWLPGGADLTAIFDAVGVTSIQLRLEMKRDAEFAQQVARAAASQELLQMSNVINAGKDEKNWRASVWWIERRTRERRRAAGGLFSEERILELMEVVTRAIAEEIPDPESQRRLVERLYEIAFGDSAESIAVDHPPDVAEQALLPTPKLPNSPSAEPLP